MRILTSWGSSQGGSYLDLMAFTPVSRALAHSTTPILIATDKGIYLGIPGSHSDGRPLLPAEFDRIKTELLPKAKVWVVAAEGDAPIAKLREALDLIAGAGGSVVLASPLASASGPGKRSSRYDHRVNEGEPFACSQAMKDGVAGNRAGEWNSNKVFKAGAMIEAATASCGDGLGVGAGGGIHVMMRVNTRGTIEEACAETDDTGNVALRKCVIQEVRKVHLPKLDKPGIMSFGTAAVFRGKPVRAVCDP